MPSSFIFTGTQLLSAYVSAKSGLPETEYNRRQIKQAKEALEHCERELERRQTGIDLKFVSLAQLQEKCEQGKFIFAYYKAEREVRVETYTNIEKIEFREQYGIEEKTDEKLIKYLVNLKATQAFTKDPEKSEKIQRWFQRFENILQIIFEDDVLELKFNDDTFQFFICETGREPFDFNTMSSGYAAIFAIISDLIVRMEAQSGLRTEFDSEGIILVDEIETHLHLKLQKKIFPILTELFPNLQFIISTHSPFILSSLDNTVIYDLENKKLVQNGMKNLPYEGIVEGYFEMDRLSEELRRKLERYKTVVSKENLSDEESVIMTADLIESCFEKRNTGIREAACQHRIEKLGESMNILYKTLVKHKKYPEAERYRKSLKSALSRKSTFSAFKRNYVRKYIEDYLDLEEFLV